MNQQVHRILMFVGSIAAGFAGLTGATDVIDPQIMSVVALIGAAVIMVANAWRVYFPASEASE